MAFLSVLLILEHMDKYSLWFLFLVLSVGVAGHGLNQSDFLQEFSDLGNNKSFVVDIQGLRKLA